MTRIVTTFFLIFFLAQNYILHSQKIITNSLAIKSFITNADTTKRRHKWLRWRWKNEKPFIELNYGIGEPIQKNFYSAFSKDGLLEIKLGFNSNEKIDGYNILEIDEHFIFGSKVSPSIYKNPQKTKRN
ncbi:hypothetical protein ABRY23_04215 [Melioribacteraceae bacterium 4301-Me]|uniref:hypothetical protein n=1 Tax=Pyranulibacter aquaticus TaxID=3163344 RepID=UPI00359A24ED